MYYKYRAEIRHIDGTLLTTITDNDSTAFMQTVLEAQGDIVKFLALGGDPDPENYVIKLLIDHFPIGTIDLCF